MRMRCWNIVLQCSSKDDIAMALQFLQFLRVQTAGEHGNVLAHKQLPGIHRCIDEPRDSLFFTFMKRRLWKMFFKLPCQNAVLCTSPAVWPSYCSLPWIGPARFCNLWDSNQSLRQTVSQNSLHGPHSWSPRCVFAWDPCQWLPCWTWNGQFFSNKFRSSKISLVFHSKLAEIEICRVGETCSSPFKAPNTPKNLLSKRSTPTWYRHISTVNWQSHWGWVSRAFSGRNGQCGHAFRELNFSAPSINWPCLMFVLGAMWFYALVMGHS